MTEQGLMESPNDLLRGVETITFDCYGTLIDWRAGLTRSFLQLFGPAANDRMQELCEAYVEIEADVEAGSYQSYRAVITETAQRLASRFGFVVTSERSGLLAELLPTWQPFADTNEALNRLSRRYRLGVLSNIDRDLFAQTAQHFDVAFDFVVTAEDVRAYKPDIAHFERLMTQHGDKRKSTGITKNTSDRRVLHVAQSLFHDGMPCSRLGIRYVWINRYNDANRTPITPLAEYPDLRSLAVE